jgi:hypothetical protein
MSVDFWKKEMARITDNREVLDTSNISTPNNSSHNIIGRGHFFAPTTDDGYIYLGKEGSSNEVYIFHKYDHEIRNREIQLLHSSTGAISHPLSTMLQDTDFRATKLPIRFNSLLDRANWIAVEHGGDHTPLGMFLLIAYAMHGVRRIWEYQNGRNGENEIRFGMCAKVNGQDVCFGCTVEGKNRYLSGNWSGGRDAAQAFWAERQTGIFSQKNRDLVSAVIYSFLFLNSEDDVTNAASGWDLGGYGLIQYEGVTFRSWENDRLHLNSSSPTIITTNQIPDFKSPSLDPHFISIEVYPNNVGHE